MAARLIFTKLLSFDQARKEVVSMSATQYDPAAIQASRTKEATLCEMVAAKCT
ncbi:MAG: hypothetical protein WAT12_06450 [Candidatus Nitrotoga sp.]